MNSNWQVGLELLAHVLAWTAIFGAALGTAISLIQTILASFALRSRPPVSQSTVLWRRYSDLAPPISILVPAYNEELTVVESVTSLLALEYPSFEVIVVNDGSKDRTLAALIEGFQLVPTFRVSEDTTPHKAIRGLYAAEGQRRLLIVDKENGGKADALNAAINLSRAPIICAIDADSLLESDALLRAVQPFISRAAAGAK